MTMVYCRGCGKEIHPEAPHCPHCGAPQANSKTSRPHWMSITAVIVGGLAFLASFDFNPRDKDQIVGIVLFGVVSIVLASIPLYQKKPGQTLSVIALVLACLGLLICFGKLP